MDADQYRSGAINGSGLSNVPGQISYHYLSTYCRSQWVDVYYVTFHIAEVMVPRYLFYETLNRIKRLGLI